jgi:DNA-binding response OmpR family regulator
MSRILVAEDDKNFGIVLQSELEENGYAVVLVSDGVEAVLNFLSGTFDIVLLDIRMPRLTGVDTVRIIKKINPRVPVITYSGDAESIERNESIEAGAMKCLAKPFGIGQLKEDIKVGLASAKLQGTILRS